MIAQPPNNTVHWLSDADYKKAVSQLRMQYQKVLAPFDAYGLGVFIPGAVTAAVKLAEDFGLRVRGLENHQISFEQATGQVHIVPGNTTSGAEK